MMLKDRDKKLLFYSWSYGILAASLIYACCGYGALAIVEKAPISIIYLNNAGCGAVNAGPGVLTDAYDGIGQIGNYVSTSAHCQYWDVTFTSAVQLTEWRFFAMAHGQSPHHVTIYEWDGADYNQAVYDSDLDMTGGAWNNYTGLNSSWSNANYRVYIVSGNTYLDTGEIEFEEGSALPDAPVINDFTSDASCYNPAEAIVLESNVTGDVDEWLWEIYDSNDNPVWSSNDSVETIVDEVFDPGLYQVQLYVENTGGSDFLSKDNWLNVTNAGGCLALNNWSPFPTITVTPQDTLFPEITKPVLADWNMTGVNDLINQSSLGNASIGYRNYWDKMAEQVNTTLLGSVYVVISPFSTIITAISNGLTLFSSAFTALQGYTTVPLAITAIVINYMPWQIVTLITAGIAIDAILIIVLGVR